MSYLFFDQKGHRSSELKRKQNSVFSCAQYHKTKIGEHFSQSDPWDLRLVSNLSFMILGIGVFNVVMLRLMFSNVLEVSLT
jgi:hypothetical protein